MSKYLGLSEFVGFNSEFRNAINLDLNLNHRGKLQSYIPTKSSVDILKRYLKAIINNQMHASMLIGPYGKGKSHLLLVLLAIISLDITNDEDKKVLDQLTAKIRKVDDEAAECIEKLVNASEGRFLPVIINCQEDVNQSFLLGMNRALNRNGLGDLTPNTDYTYAVEVIDNWQNNYPDTYSDYHEHLKAKKISLNAMKAELLQYNRDYLQIFKELYPQLTSGSVFNPLAEGDVTRVYMSVADKLREEYGYRGLYIVFDEFSKFIEGQDKISAGLNMKLVQDICEMAGDSKDPQIYVTLVAHKPIKEYGNKLSQETINSFIGIEGRLDAEVLFVTSAKNNYELIENAILKDGFDINNLPSDVKDIYFSEAAIDDVFVVPGYEAEFTREDFENIVVKGCYPLTPISAYLLLSISEKVAQNERTLFTFISKEEPGSMPEIVKESVGKNGIASSLWSITPDVIFDYFTNLFKDEADEIKRVYEKSITALEIADRQANNTLLNRIIKTLAVLMIVDKSQELPWNEDILCLAVNMNYSDSSKERFSEAISKLVALDIIELDGNNFYKFKTIEGKELESVIQERWHLVANENAVKDILLSIYPNKYVFPKKYNYEFGMTRFFRYVFCDVNDFLALNNAETLYENGIFCDGRIICLYQHDEKNYSEKIKEKLKDFGSYKIVVMYAHKIFEIEEDVLKLQVINDILEDYNFMEKNGRLLAEIQGLKDNIENKILSYLVGTYGRFGEYEIVYFYNNDVVNTESSSISECIDELCYKIYDATPVINNEFVNKQNITTGATKTARKNIMERLLMNDSVEDYMSGTSQDATIFRALFVRNGLVTGEAEPRISKVIELFDEFIASCTGSRKKVASIINVLVKEPYGLRLGLLPIYFAYVIGKKTSDMVVYYGDKEIPMTTDTIINMCDYPSQYEIYVSETDAAREEYLNRLTDLFGVVIDNTSSDSRISQIFNGMQKWYRALPQVTTNVKNNIEYFDESFYKKALLRMSNILQRYEVNPYEALFEQIPAALGADKELEKCIKRMSQFKKKLQEYYNWLLDRTVVEAKSVFSRQEDSLFHILTEWYGKQSDMAKGTIGDQFISSFMKVISTLEKTQIASDKDIIDNVVKAISGVHVDYWNDASLNQFVTKLGDLKERIEAIKDVEVTTSSNKAVYTSRSGQQFYYEKVESDETEMFRDVLSGTIEDFEGLGKNDLIAVLLDEVERILQDKE